jgi:hypothetical protein
MHNNFDFIISRAMAKELYAFTYDEVGVEKQVVEEEQDYIDEQACIDEQAYTDECAYQEAVAKVLDMADARVYAAKQTARLHQPY